METSSTALTNRSSTRYQRNLMLLAFIFLCEATGIVSGLLAGSFRTFWFESLLKPSWFPPTAVFGIAWTTLYLLMGISLWLVWKTRNASPAPTRPSHSGGDRADIADQNKKSKPTAELFFAAQLFLNFWWSIIFFKFHAVGAAYAEIVVMIVMVVVTMVKFSRISRVATWLLIPYLGWIIFASFLNLSIWQMNG